MESGGKIKSAISMILVFTGTVASIVCFYYMLMGIQKVLAIEVQPSILPSLVNSYTMSLSNPYIDNNADKWQQHIQDKLTVPEGIALPEWGSYRPGYYFGMKTRSIVTSLTTGILWKSNSNKQASYRHTTREGEIDKFEWIRHDGKAFGVETVIDKANNIQFNVSYVIPNALASIPQGISSLPPAWIQRLELQSIDSNLKNEKSIVFYFGIECSKDRIGFDNAFESTFGGFVSIASSNAAIIRGSTKQSGHFYLMLSVFEGVTHSPVEANITLANMDNIDVRNGVFKFIGNGNSDNKIDTKSDRITFVAVEVASISSAFSIQAVYYENKAGLYFEQNCSMDDASAEWDKVSSTLTSNSIDNFFSTGMNAFDTKFEQSFNRLYGNRLESGANEFNAEDVEASKVALSSLLGGIGHFYGTPEIADGSDINSNGDQVSNGDSKGNRGKEKTGFIEPVSLLTSTPSRTSFPRGFLWDEGFHQLLISKWDIALTVHIITDWMNAMYVRSVKDGNISEIEQYGGWIPREMILGDEARSRVPGEFIPQRVNIANPPTFFLVIENILNDINHNDTTANTKNVCQIEKGMLLTYLRDLYPYLRMWLNWYLQSQSGPTSVPGGLSFRWRGRSNSDHKLVPNTLASGLDDYPRAQLPTSNEHHLDLMSWMVKATSVISLLRTTLINYNMIVDDSSSDASYIDYGSMSIYFEEQLDKLHWSDKHKSYLDVGMSGETETVVAEIFVRCRHDSTQRMVDVSIPISYINEHKPKPESLCPAEYPVYMQVLRDGQNPKVVERVQVTNYTLQHVPRIGYLSLYPFLLCIVSPSSPKLTAILDQLSSEEMLWTAHGLRSIAKSDTFYQKANAPGDNPYWRGPIWININYLSLKALKHYSSVDGPMQQRATELYMSLRSNVINTILTSYRRTGYFWEQYNDMTGAGMRGHPFTGWTALIVNIMAESY